MSAVQFDVAEKSIAALQAALAAGEVTSRALVEAYLVRIEAYDGTLNAIIAVNPRALEYADALDRERRATGARGPLHGIPVVIKDNMETIDMPTTGGSIALAGFSTGADAFQVRRLRDAGAIILAKTNLHELASGITTVSSMGGQTRNPYAPSRHPGGSSGGTAAAVAASFAAAGMGSDTCGSIRIPAGACNLFGLRATPGFSSLAGIIPLSHTQDVAGPLARTVGDLVTMLEVTAGEGLGVSGSRGLVVFDPGALRGKRIGVLLNLAGDEEVTAVGRGALEAMQACGAEIEDVTIDGLDEPLIGSSLIPFEFKFDLMDYLARFPDAPVHSLSEILERGAYHPELEKPFRARDKAAARDSEEERAARANRDVVRALVVETMNDRRLDVLAYPPMLSKPVIAGERQLGIPHCMLSPACGFPSICVPAGFTGDGVPIGIELLGRAWDEPKLLAMAYAYEQAVRPRRAPVTNGLTAASADAMNASRSPTGAT